MQKGRNEVRQSPSRKAKPTNPSKSAKAAKSAKAVTGGGIMERVRAELGLIAGIVSTVIFFTIGEPWVSNLDSLQNLIVLARWFGAPLASCAMRMRWLKSWANLMAH